MKTLHLPEGAFALGTESGGTPVVSAGEAKASPLP